MRMNPLLVEVDGQMEALETEAAELRGEIYARDLEVERLSTQIKAGPYRLVNAPAPDAPGWWWWSKVPFPLLVERIEKESIHVSRGKARIGDGTWTGPIPEPE